MPRRLRSVPPPPPSSPGLAHARPRLSSLDSRNRDARFRVSDALDAYLRSRRISNVEFAEATGLTEHAVRDMREGLRPIQLHRLALLPEPHRSVLPVLLLEAGRERAA